MFAVIVDDVIDFAWIDEVVRFENGHDVGAGLIILYNLNLIL